MMVLVDKLPFTFQQKTREQVADHRFEGEDEEYCTLHRERTVGRRAPISCSSANRVCDGSPRRPRQFTDIDEITIPRTSSRYDDHPWPLFGWTIRRVHRCTMYSVCTT